MMAASDPGATDDSKLSFTAAKKPRAAKSAAAKEDWTEWKPRWSEKEKSPHDFQESHSPTEAVVHRVSSEKDLRKSRRRIVDARLWSAMETQQQQAALEIALAFETMGRGLGYVVSDWQRVPGASGPSSAAEAHSRLIHSYVDWTKRCHKDGVSHSMIVDILVFGFTCRALDRDRRVRAGTSRENLMAGLALYCELRGWERRKP